MTETKISKQAIRVYAALNALKGSEDGDVIDALLPFIMPVLNLSRGKILSTELLVLGLGKLYGWRITHDIAEKFQDRLCAKGFLVKSSQPNHAVSYFCNPPAEPPPSTENISFANSLSEVIDEFVTFAPTLSSLFVKERERDNLEETLVKFLVSLDVYTDDALLSQLRKMKSSDEIDDQSKKLVDGIGTLTDEDRYLCARFIEKMYKDKSPLLQHLSKIAAVGLLAEVVSDFIKPTTNVLKSDLVVVLDAPLAMNALGTSGNFAKDEISTLIAALKSVGCQVIVLSTSCKEISRNLHTMLKEERGNRWGPTHRAMVKGEVGEDFVRLVIADPEKALISTGIQVRKVDLSDPMIGLKYFTKDMLEDFKLGIQWKSLDARDHDAECVASIMRFRNGIHRKDPMDCTHVFVTGNNRLALYARKYCLHNQSINQNACGPVLALQDIATIAWLRTGFGEAEALPRKHMLAACEKVLAVQKSVVTKVTEELGKVSPVRRQVSWDKLVVLNKGGFLVHRIKTENWNETNI